MKLLNQLKFRIAFSLLIGLIYAMAAALWSGAINNFSVYSVIVAAVVVFIPLTVVWAIISTFFMDDEDKSSDDVIDN